MKACKVRVNKPPCTVDFSTSPKYLEARLPAGIKTHTI